MYICISYTRNGGRERNGEQRKNMSIGTESTERARIVLTSLLAAIKNELETKKSCGTRVRSGRRGWGGVQVRLKSRALCSHAVSSSYRYPVTFCGGPRIAQIFE